MELVVYSLIVASVENVELEKNDLKVPTRRHMVDLLSKDCVSPKHEHVTVISHDSIYDSRAVHQPQLRFSFSSCLR
jgi:hypothetical protein